MTRFGESTVDAKQDLVVSRNVAHNLYLPENKKPIQREEKTIHVICSYPYNELNLTSEGGAIASHHHLISLVPCAFHCLMCHEKG